MKKQKTKLQLKHSEPWTEKYRPTKLEDIIAQDQHIQTIQGIYEKGIAEVPNLLFYGPPGIGKTTLARILARMIYGDDWTKYTKQINASEDRNVEFMKKLKDQIQILTKHPTSKFNLVIFDEADMITREAQELLKRTTEQCSSYARFIFICNSISKIREELHSRCTKCFFNLPEPNACIQRLSAIQRNEGIENLLNDAELYYLVSRCNKDLRKSVSILQILVCILSTEDSKTWTETTSEYITDDNFICDENPRQRVLELIDEQTQRIQTSEIERLWSSILTNRKDPGISIYKKMKSVSGYTNYQIFTQIVEMFLDYKGDSDWSKNSKIGSQIAETEVSLSNSVQFNNVFALPLLFTLINRQIGCS